MCRRAASGYLALALLLAPLLGLMHGLVHGAVDYRPAAYTYIAEADSHTNQHNWVAGLFAAHCDASDCRVLDQRCHSDIVPAVPWLGLSVAPAFFGFHFSAEKVLTGRFPFFDARGPPLTR